MMRVGLIQTCAGDVPVENLAQTQALIAKAATQGAQLVQTPEVTNCISTSRSHQKQVLQPEAEDITLAALRTQAADLGIWILIGSLALQSDDPAGRFVNRGFLIDPKGQITARYDKIHMFDVTVSDTESYRESAGYRPGDTAVLAQAAGARIGMTICYDVRFPSLYRQLAQAGAGILSVPSAFSPVTGAAHWHTLLRARAIETGSFVLAAAQTGAHRLSRGKPRSTYGHTLAVDPWGAVLLDAGTETGVWCIDLDLTAVDRARARIPAVGTDQDYRMIHAPG